MELRRSDLKDDPIEQFADWFTAANASEDVYQANAMCIATVDVEGYPDNRFVLLKDYDKDGFIFYTNYSSTKGSQLLDIPKIAATIYWKPLKRQIRIQGDVEPITDHVADVYFATRSRDSQIGAWASKQSRPLPRKEFLLGRFNQYTEKFTGKEVPRPDYWSGFRIIPKKIEFWQSGSARLHDRFEYRKTGDQWEIQRLYP